MTFASTTIVGRGLSIVAMERTIEATTTVRGAHARVRGVLVDDPGSVLCETCSEKQRRARRFLTQLAVEIGGGASVHQEVEIHLGAPGPEAGFTVPVSWKATGHESLYPTFDGALQASPDRSGTRLTLKGTYHLPLGTLGRVGDKVAGRKLAHWSPSSTRWRGASTPKSTGGSARCPSIPRPTRSASPTR